MAAVVEDPAVKVAKPYPNVYLFFKDQYEEGVLQKTVCTEAAILALSMASAIRRIRTRNGGKDPWWLALEDTYAECFCEHADGDGDGDCAELPGNDTPCRVEIRAMHPDKLLDLLDDDVHLECFRVIEVPNAAMDTWPADHPDEDEEEQSDDSSDSEEEEDQAEEAPDDEEFEELQKEKEEEEAEWHKNVRADYKKKLAKLVEKDGKRKRQDIESSSDESDDDEKPEEESLSTRMDNFLAKEAEDDDDVVPPTSSSDEEEQAAEADAAVKPKADAPQVKKRKA